VAERLLQIWRRLRGRNFFGIRIFGCGYNVYSRRSTRLCIIKKTRSELSTLRVTQRHLAVITIIRSSWSSSSGNWKPATATSEINQLDNGGVRLRYCTPNVAKLRSGEFRLDFTTGLQAYRVQFSVAITRAATLHPELHR